MKAKPTPTSRTVFYSNTTGTSAGATYPIGPKVTTNRATAEIENAVYGHLRALRALGRTKLNVSEVAEALKIPATAVLGAVNALREKGFKLV
jgi:hypothetical protein